MFSFKTYLEVIVSPYKNRTITMTPTIDFFFLQYQARIPPVEQDANIIRKPLVTHTSHVSIISVRTFYLKVLYCTLYYSQVGKTIDDSSLPVAHIPHSSTMNDSQQKGSFQITSKLIFSISCDKDILCL